MAARNPEKLTLPAGCRDYAARMPTLTARDGIELAYHVDGDGEPLVCVPGGPMRASSYFGDLGGLAVHCRVVRLDLRGTGDSTHDVDPETCRADRLTEDIEMLRKHLRVKRINVLGHSAGANVAVRYAEMYPQRISHLILSNPSPFAVGLETSMETRTAIVHMRRTEPWYYKAGDAFQRIAAGEATDEDWAAMAPFFYGTWDETAQAHYAADVTETNYELAEAFRADGAYQPDVTRAALATFDPPVLILAGEVDINSAPPVMAQYAGLFPNAELVVQPGAGHFPWLDDATAYTDALATFLKRPAPSILA